MSTNPAEVSVRIDTSPAAREWTNGFLLLGILLGLLGSLVLAWQYHIDTDPVLIGLHFLGLNAGYVVGGAFAQRLLLRWPVRRAALAGCANACASLLALSLAAPPAAAFWRIGGLAWLGLAAGTLTTSLLYVLERDFEAAPAAVANRAGVLFGSGCLVATLMVAITYFAGSAQIETALLAIIPVIFLFLYAGNRYAPALTPITIHHEKNKIRESLRSFRSIAAVLFSLLLFFQFGNEWAIAGWLPLFLVHRLGANPVWAILALAQYFLALMLGRLISKKLLVRVSHTKLLLASISVAMTGYLALSFAPTIAGAWIAVVVIGAGFAPIFPLIAETLDTRFSYHPGFYNGIFSIAITGAMSAPFLLGYVAGYLGIRYVILLPAAGSIVVLILALLIMLEAHLMGTRRIARLEPAGAARD